MAGVLERIRWPQKRTAIRHSSPSSRINLRVLELEAAREMILAEIFWVRISDMVEMIQSRFDEIFSGANSYEETEQWPQEFRVAKEICSWLPMSSSLSRTKWPLVLSAMRSLHQAQSFYSSLSIL
jgi:hypothetical protein